MFIVGNVSPENTQPGDSFEAQAASDVAVDGIIIVRKGADGQGTIAQGRRSAGPTALTLQMTWVYAVDGTKIALSSTGLTALGTTRAAWQGGRAPFSLATFGMAGYFGVVSAFANGNVSVQPVTGAARSVRERAAAR